MVGSILGNRVPRTEDVNLLTDGGRYVYDLPLDNVAHAYFVRSTVAHATIKEINIDEAIKAPGVIGVITADELGMGPINPGLQMVSDTFARTPLATDTVRYVGDPVVVIVAETFQQAVDAAELVYIDYDYLPTIVDPEAALDENTDPIFPAKGNNVAFTLADPADDVLADATHLSLIHI